ncbi:hypothetical protein D9M73_146060 [compost metagenome]
MRGIARRLDRDIGAAEPARQIAAGFKGIEHRIDMRGETGVEGHGKSGHVSERGP